MIRGLYLCIVLILGTTYASLVVPYTPSHIYGCNGGLEASASYVRHEYIKTDTTDFSKSHASNMQYALIYINTATQTITAYDPQTDTHSAIFTCPEACYDPSADENGRIGFVSASGFGIFDTISGDYTQLSADFGVYGYKGGVAFRSDLAYVAYEGRFNMQMRLLLTDLSTGETTDLGSSGIGNPAWSWDNQAVLVSDGYSLLIVPIDGGDLETVEFGWDGVDLFQPYDAENWFFRGTNNNLTGVHFGNLKDGLLVYEGGVNSALITYTVTDTLAGMIFFSARGGAFYLVVVEWETGAVVYELEAPSEMLDIALAPDNQYVAWTEENADMGFGFYDLWIADLSAPSITPVRIAEQISDSGTRPSALTWMRRG